MTTLCFHVVYWISFSVKNKFYDNRRKKVGPETAIILIKSHISDQNKKEYCQAQPQPQPQLGAVLVSFPTSPTTVRHPAVPKKYKSIPI